MCCQYFIAFLCFSLALLLIVDWSVYVGNRWFALPCLPLCSCTGWSVSTSARLSTPTWSGTLRMSTRRRGRQTWLLWWLPLVSGKKLHWYYWLFFFFNWKCSIPAVLATLCLKSAGTVCSVLICRKISAFLSRPTSCVTMLPALWLAKDNWQRPSINYDKQKVGAVLLPPSH